MDKAHPQLILVRLGYHPQILWPQPDLWHSSMWKMCWKGQTIRILMLRIQVSVQILIPLIFYSSQFILIFHSCEHLQSASVCCVCCDYCDCIVSQGCDSVTSALFQRLRYEFVCSSLFWTVSYFSFRQFVR